MSVEPSGTPAGGVRLEPGSGGHGGPDRWLHSARQSAAWRWQSLSRAVPTRDLVAISLAGGGALLVFVSLLVDWQTITMPDRTTFGAGIADIPTWGTLYGLGAMALIAVFVCVVALPTALAASARVLGIAWALGVAGVIVAMLVRLTDAPGISAGGVALDLLGGESAVAGTAVAWGAGVVYAAIAVAMLMGAFIAACPPLREIAPPPLRDITSNPEESGR